MRTRHDRRAIAAAGLNYSSDRDPGMRRVKSGKGFSYRAPDGTTVRDRATLQRVRALAIPPAYEDVWICLDPRGHLQATGRDARGRKQYRYHPDWRVLRDDGKFERMAQFGRHLPQLRRRIAQDLALPGLPRTKVLAAVAALLDRTWLRVGNREYARDNGSFGLTTLRNHHVEFAAQGRARLRFRGKGGQWQERVLDDAHLVDVVRHIQQLPGQALFQYLDDDGKSQPVDSGMVNDWLREAMGEDFTAKDFRTWGGTLRALELMSRQPRPEPCSERALAGCIAGAVRQVAAELGNTPAVCRKSYIHPGVFEHWRRGALAAPAVPRRRARLRATEGRALAFLRRINR